MHGRCDLGTGLEIGEERPKYYEVDGTLVVDPQSELLASPPLESAVWMKHLALSLVRGVYSQVKRQLPQSVREAAGKDCAR